MHLEKLSKKELMDIAAQKSIPQRSKMTKPQLIEVLEPFFKKFSQVEEKNTTSSQQGYAKIDKKVVMPKKDEYPIPDFYNQDTLVLLPVDPSKEFVYWELNDVTLEEYRTKLNIKSNKPTLKIFKMNDSGMLEVASVSVERLGNWYFNVYASNDVVWAEIGLLDNNGVFHSILKSKTIKMPSDKVSTVIDEETWLTIGGDLDKIYRLSGVGKHDHHISSEHLHQAISQHIASSGFMKEK